MASWDGRLEFGIGFQRRGLACFDNSKWFMVQINANREFGFQSRMTDIRAAATLVFFISTRSYDQPE
jgi:hypothetical protein